MSEQPRPTPGRENVTEALITLLRQRQEKGIATYGTTLQTFNGRDATRDLIEELVDALQYAVQWQLERGEMLKEIEQLYADNAVLKLELEGADAEIFILGAMVAGYDRDGWMSSDKRAETIRVGKKRREIIRARHPGNDFLSELGRLRCRAEKCRKTLLDVEWGQYNNATELDVCPKCWATIREGHKKTCVLAEALKDD